MEERIDALLEEYNLISNKIAELKLIKRLLNEIKIEEENYINIGGMILAKAKILDDKFLVNVGSRVFIEKKKEEIINIIDQNILQLEKRKEEIEKIIKSSQ